MCRDPQRVYDKLVQEFNAMNNALVGVIEALSDAKVVCNGAREYFNIGITTISHNFSQLAMTIARYGEVYELEPQPLAEEAMARAKRIEGIELLSVEEGEEVLRSLDVELAVQSEPRDVTAKTKVNIH